MGRYITLYKDFISLTITVLLSVWLDCGNLMVPNRLDYFSIGIFAPQLFISLYAKKIVVVFLAPGQNFFKTHL